MSKPNEASIRLLAGLGVEGDAHLGETVKHRSRVKRDPSQPNLRQVHLIHAELHDELRARGFDVAPGQMGENITTRGVDLLALPTGTRLHLGRQRRRRGHRAAQPVRAARRHPAGTDGGDARARRARRARAQGRRHGRSCSPAARCARAIPIRVELPPAPHRALEPV